MIQSKYLFLVIFLFGLTVVGCKEAKKPVVKEVAAMPTAQKEAPKPVIPKEVAKKIKVLVYGGGVIHDFKGINQAVMEILGACPRVEAVSVTDNLIPAPPAKPGEQAQKPTVESKLDEAIAKLADCDVLFVHHTGGKLTEAQEKAICDAIASGKGFVGIHSAADSFKQNAKYIEMLGGVFIKHPAYGDINAVVLDPDHPIVKDVPKEFTVKDEQYLLKYDPAKIHVLCEAPYKYPIQKEIVERKDGKEVKKRVPTGEVETGRMPAVWIKNWEKGRVVYISFCHDRKATEQEVVKKIILQAVLWAGTLVP
jgi:type 1 glutamine amidotransferase